MKTMEKRERERKERRSASGLEMTVDRKTVLRCFALNCKDKAVQTMDCCCIDSMIRVF